MRRGSARVIWVPVLGLVSILAALTVPGCRERGEPPPPPTGPLTGGPIMPATGLSGPEADVARTFVARIQARSFDAAYELLSPTSRRTLTAGQWQRWANAGPSSLSLPLSALATQTTRYEVTQVSITRDTASATVRFSGAKAFPLPVVQEKGRWWVDLSDGAQLRLELGGVLAALPGRYHGAMGQAPAWLLALASPLVGEPRAIELSQNGPQTVVSLDGTGSVEARVPLERGSDGRWRADLDRGEILAVATGGGTSFLPGAPPAPPRPEAPPPGPTGPRPALSPAAGRAPHHPSAPPATHPATPQTAQESACLSNLRQLSLGMLMYAQDYDERLPRSRGWSDVVYPYIKSKGIFLCPAVRGDRPGYAVNAPLDVLSLSRFESCAHTVMLFDSDALVRNAADRGGSWPVPPRHSGGNNAAYVDGHVKWLRDKPDFAVSLQPR